MTRGVDLAAPAQVVGPHSAPQANALAAPPNGQTWRVYYYAGSARIALRVQQAGAPDVVYYLHGDHLGSTSLVTSQGQGVASRQLYHPYGSVRASEGTLPTDFTYTGQRADATGLMYFRARYYSSGLGRFLSADTIVPSPGNPQDLNRYSYTRNNPLNYMDPSGHGPISEWLISVGRSGPAGKALVVSMGAVAEHISQQTNKVFYPGANTSTTDRLLACAEIGGGSVLVAASAVELAAGTLATAAASGGTTAVAATAGTVTTAASADGDPLNEITVAGQAASGAIERGGDIVVRFVKQAHFEQIEQTQTMPVVNYQSYATTPQFLRNIGTHDPTVIADELGIKVERARYFVAFSRTAMDNAAQSSGGRLLSESLREIRWLIKMEEVDLAGYIVNLGRTIEDLPQFLNPQ